MGPNRDGFEFEAQFPDGTPVHPVLPEVEQLLGHPAVDEIIYWDQDDQFRGDGDPVGRIANALGVERHIAQEAYDIRRHQKVPFPGEEDTSRQ